MDLLSASPLTPQPDLSHTTNPQPLALCQQVLKLLAPCTPVTVTRPSLSAKITWSRLMADVDPGTAVGSAASGRIPAQAASRSSGRTGTLRWSRSASRINATSVALAAGRSVMTQGVSVVPAMSTPCQGSKKITRPS